MVRVRYSRAVGGVHARQKQYAQRIKQLRAMRANPVAGAPATSPTIQARTVFVWPRMGLRCGIAEYVKHMVAAADGAVACQKTSEVLHAEHVVLVLMPSLGEPVTELVNFVRRVRARGTRVTLDIHHLTVGQNHFAQLFGEVNDTVWHLPQMPALAGAGRYVPLPVPTLPRSATQHVGGLTHFGLGHVSKRIPVMAQVARDLGTRLYVYGDRNREFVPPELAGHVTVSDSYPSEAELSRLLQQHDVGLIGRARWSSQVQLNGSASARFLIGADVPSVVDAAPAHEDLRNVLDVVSFDDPAQVVAAARRLLEPGYRTEALERMRQYAAATSPRKVAEQMNVAVRA
jgi:hypothetical protein